jgi:hypothetical protein
MLTVKLMKDHTVTIIEATEVKIFPAGHAKGSGGDPKKRTNEVREIEVKLHSGNTVGGYYVADPHKPRPQGWAEEVEFYDCAYIENAHGATTERVHAY